MYGDNAGNLRVALTGLLREHRIQRRVDAPALPSIHDATPAEQLALGQQMTRYRNAVLTWSLQAVRATRPDEGVGLRAQNAVQRLQLQLFSAINDSHAGRPALDQLTKSQNAPTVEAWRQAARAAALGEHDFTAGIDYEHLNLTQRRTVLKDAVDVTRAVIALDRHYEGVPGWERLRAPDRLADAASACSLAAGVATDYRVDLSGWRPPPNSFGQPRTKSEDGLAGILEAARDLLENLREFPSAHTMRLVLDAQRIVSHEVASRTRKAMPRVAEKWEARRDSYTHLIRETRDLGGLLGAGQPVATQASILASRAKNVPTTHEVSRHTAHRLDELFTLIDTRLADAIERGVARHLYVWRAALPRLDRHAGGVVQPVRTRYVPLSPRAGSNLVNIARRRLQPSVSCRVSVPESAAKSRRDLDQTLNIQSSNPEAPPPLSL